MITRRKVIMAGSASIAAVMMPTFLWGSENKNLAKARQESDLIYLTPIRSDGEESSCQAEVWFVADGDDLYIVTASDSWRARAVRKGLHDTRIWIGDLGEWKSTDGKYRSLPQLDMKGSEVLDADAFSLFQEKGIFDKNTSRKFKSYILEKGGTEKPMDLYLKFRGQKPSNKALLKRAGLLK